MKFVSISALLTFISVSIYGVKQGGYEDFDTLSWGYALAIISMVCHAAAPIPLTLQLRIIYTKVNETPLISPASSNDSLDKEETSDHVPIEMQIPLDVRMRTNSFYVTNSEYTPVDSEQTFSFSEDAIQETFHFDSV